MMENAPLLSVVVLSYNHSRYIEKCLESIFDQKTDYSYEVLLADDHSPDQTAELVREKYGDRIRILSRSENLGLCRNMYDAYMQAKGKYILTCAGDDYLPVKDAFESHVRYLEEHEEIFSVTGWHEIYNVNKGVKTLVKVPYDSYSLLDFLSGKRQPVYEGTMRNTFEEDKPDYLCQGSRNNEEMQMIYYALNKGERKILPQLYYTYCYRNKEGTEEVYNYNSTHSHLEMLEDYARGFRAIERVDQKKHNFSLAKIAYYEGCIDYHIQDHGMHGVFDIWKVLGTRDFMSFIGIKLLMKLNHRRIPSFLRREKRLIRR